MLDDGSISIYLLLNGCPVNGSTLCDEQIIARHGLSACSCNVFILTQFSPFYFLQITDCKQF